jgi:hypothetical protein
MAENTASTLSSLFKESYPDQVLKAYPDFAFILKNTKFSGAAAQTGGKFIQPFIATREHGWTYGPSGSGALYLAGATPMTSARAEMLGSQLIGQAAIDYEAAARASKSKASFIDATELIVENLLESGAFRLEQMFLYGQSGIAVATTGTTGTSFVVADKDWCPAMFAGLQTAPVAVYDSAGAFRNGATNGHCTISSVNFSTRTITLSAAVTGLASGDILGFRNGWNGTNSALTNEPLGLKAILTSATTLYGLTIASYPILDGQQKDFAAANLTVTGLLDMVMLAVNHGLKKNIKIMVSPSRWQNLVNPIIDPKATSGTSTKVGTVVTKELQGKRLEFGVDSIVIHTQAGRAEIVPHMLVRNGDVFAVPLEDVRRVGAQELSFTTPGRDEEIFVHSATHGAYELRCYANQALFVEKPAHCVYGYDAL